jgi:hypothetical protein
MATDAEEDDMPNWHYLVENHKDKAQCVKEAVQSALMHVTEALFDLVTRNEWRKSNGQSLVQNSCPSVITSR